LLRSFGRRRRKVLLSRRNESLRQKSWMKSMEAFKIRFPGNKK
jgi:hypothetical protein